MRMLITLFSTLLFAVPSFAQTESEINSKAAAAFERGDYVTTMELLRPLAEKGYAFAQIYLGVMYNNGPGVPRDYAEAVRWQRKAADQGDASGQFYLGLKYEDGHGVPQDYAEAVRWQRKAAEQGLAMAQHQLGLMYEQGKGVPRNYVEAHFWLNLAAPRASGDDQKRFASARDEVAKRMTPQQLAEAQRRAREWKPKSGADKDGRSMK